VQYIASEPCLSLCQVQSNKFNLVSRALLPATAKSITPFITQDRLLSIVEVISSPLNGGG